ncbi:MAG: 2-hydroxy-3-oxopropionate reductase [Deltaproteobacteria bacterium RBG_16_47_11]|nr:MAG: 2-hydroxy-3-oxopropionate reductase [Deltaproteobacteria bacterium RBG_16_47_11]
MKKKVGFIGLGIMGKPMAKNLLKAGFPIIAYDLNKDAVEDLVKAGALAARSSKEAAGRADVIITMLPDSPDVKEVILGKDGVIEGIKPGSIVIDMSSINPLVSQEIEKELRKKGVEMLDAPVSGGETGAIQGTLAIMVGGEEKVFKDCVDLFSSMGKNIVRVGGIGAGGFVKLVNQIIVALNIAAVGEAFTLGVKAGLDPQVMYQAIRGGLAGSSVLETKAPMIFGRNFKPGFKIRLHQKDLKNALSTAKDLGVPLPLSSLVQQIFVSLMTEGRGEEDHSALATFFEKMAKVEIKSIA